jgi:hypothetical protein
VLVRRQIEKPSIAPGSLIRLNSPQTTNCRVVTSERGQTAQAEKLRQLAIKLAGNIYMMSSEGAVDLKPDPGDLAEQEVEVTFELRCQDESCQNMDISQPVARMGKTPYEHSTDRSREKLQSLKRDLEPILGCMQGPDTDPNPSRDTQSIEYCGDPLRLSAGDIRRFVDVAQRHGFRVELQIQDRESLDESKSEK